MNLKLRLRLLLARERRVHRHYVCSRQIIGVTGVPLRGGTRLEKGPEHISEINFIQCNTNQK